MENANGNTTSRHSLAIDRTQLANERTILAYARTALALGAVGASSIVFFDSLWLDALGVTFLLSGAVCMSVGVRSYGRMKRRLRKRPPPAPPREGDQSPDA